MGVSAEGGTVLDVEHWLTVGGLAVLALVVFAESGLLLGFFLPGDNLFNRLERRMLNPANAERASSTSATDETGRRPAPEHSTLTRRWLLLGHGSCTSRAAATRRARTTDLAPPRKPRNMDNITGLPAHPLLVHIPVVLLPLAAIGVVFLIVRRTWYVRYRW